MTPDSVTIDSITRRICTLLVAIKSSYPQWLNDKYSHYEWESEKVLAQFRAKFKSKLSQTKDRDALVMEIMKVLHLFLVPSFFLSPEFAQLLADIRHYIHPMVTHPSMDGGICGNRSGGWGAPHPQIAILLLDAENLQLDVATEQFLTSICSYPIQIKVAFANWRSLGKKDLEFHGRGYELIHVPPGKDSADVKMATVGSSIFVHYPSAKEVFVCSSDGVMTHLCTTLQTHGLSVYLVRKQKKKITVLNTKTGNLINHSTLSTPSIPTPEEFIGQLQAIILQEQKATGNSWIKLERISQLFQQQYHITISKVVGEQLPGKKVRDVLSNYPDKLVINQPTAESGIYITVFNEGKEVKSAPESHIADYSQLSQSIASIAADLETALTLIVRDLTAKFKKTDIPITDVSSQFLKQYGISIKKTMEILELSDNFLELLESYANFRVTTIKGRYHVALVTEGKSAQKPPLENQVADSSQLPNTIKTEADLEQAITIILGNLTAESNQTNISIANVAAKFMKQYGKSITKTMKRLQLSGNFTKLLQSYSNFQLKPIYGVYHVALVTEGKSAQNNPLESQVVDYSQLPNSIETEADLETALTLIVRGLTAKSNETNISISNVDSQFMKRYRKSITETMKRLKLSGNFTKFLQSHANFQVTENHVRMRRL